MKTASLKLIMTLLMSFAFSAIVAGIVTTAFNAPHLFVGITAGLFALSIVTPAPKMGFAYMAFTQGICEKVQSSLIDVLGSNAPSIRRSQTGYIDALQSPQNLAGVTKVPIDPGNGKKKQVRLKFIQRGVESDIIEEKVADCTTTLEKEPFEQDVDITSYIGTKGLKFNEQEMRKLCEADADFMQGVIRGEIDPLIKKLNKILITTQAANFGKFNPDISPDPYKEVVLINSTSKGPIYFGESEMMEDFENLDVNGRPIVIGAGNLGHYARMANIGCCNQDGINMGQAGNMDYFRDRYVESILGANHFIGLVPGMVQLMTWNEYVGVYRKENDVFSHSTILDPVSGLTFDMKWHYNDCNDFYFVQFGLWYDMYFMPANAFGATDELFGTNGTLHYKALQSDDTAYYS